MWPISSASLYIFFAEMLKVPEDALAEKLIAGLAEVIEAVEGPS